MRYDEAILRVLDEAGADGLSVAKISRHVYNACNSFFEPLDMEEVHRYVYQFLSRNSKNPNSIIEKTGTRGMYHLNYNSNVVRQLMLDFDGAEPEETAEKMDKDDSLSLF